MSSPPDTLYLADPQQPIIVRREVRATQTIASSNPWLPANDPNKYACQLMRIAQGQDANGNPVTEPPSEPGQYLPPVKLNLAAFMGEVFTRPDNSTFTGAQFFADLQLIINAHKGDGLPVVPG